MMDKETGRFVSIDQHRFEQYEDIILGVGIDLVTVGRFDRMNLLASTENKNFYVYDNVRKAVVEIAGQHGVPLADAEAAIDSRPEYFQDDFHLTVAGHEVVAGVFASQLGPMLDAIRASKPYRRCRPPGRGGPPGCGRSGARDPLPCVPLPGRRRRRPGPPGRGLSASPPPGVGRPGPADSRRR